MDSDHTLHQFIEHAELVDLRFEELGARTTRSDTTPETPPQFRLGVRVEDLHPNDTSTPRHVEYLLRVHVHVDDGELIAEPKATYCLPAEHHSLLSTHTVYGFANDVAVMTLIPFAREALAELSLRVFNTRVLMPVIPRGALHFQPPQP